MNPLLVTAEYDLAPGEEGRNVSRRKAKKKPKVSVAKLVNPFMIMPEYERETPPDFSLSKTVGKKRKLDRSINERTSASSGDKNSQKLRLDKKEKRASAEHNGNSQGSRKSSDRKLQSRCLTTFSRKEILGKDPKMLQKHKKNNKRFEKTWSRFDPSKQNGMKAPRGFSDTSQNKKWNKKPAGDAKTARPIATKKGKTSSKHPQGKQEGPITWGLSGSSWGTSGSLTLDGMGGFNWNATPQDLANIVSNNTGVAEGESEESDDEVVVKGKKLTPAEKRAKALEEEKNMKKKEKELIEAEDDPQSPDHFERLLIGSPNSAELWIKYMGYHAVNADIEKARAVAQRAIKRIDPQLISARLDVWIAFLNLDFTFSPPGGYSKASFTKSAFERPPLSCFLASSRCWLISWHFSHAYLAQFVGDYHDLFKDTFSEAIRCNDDYAINSRVLNLYAEAKNVSEVDQLANTMVRKYKDKLENWLQCLNALMMVGLPDKARYMLQKSLTVMNKKSHVTLISRFALLENKYGFSEQADALFENLLTSFPQRVDLLNVYVDMLVKSNRIDLARSVLERAANNHLPVRKMKAIYTKWLAFEEAHGTLRDVSKVEEAAQKYVSRLIKPHATSMDDNRDSQDDAKEEAEGTRGNEEDDNLSDGEEQFESD